MNWFRSVKKQQGMTLLEVMLALVIMATSGVAVMNAASGALNSQSHLQNKTFALWVASNRLTEIKLQKIWPAASWRYDTTELAGVTWYLRYKSVETGDANFKALDIEVSDVERGRALAYMRTYIAKP
ncbi:type II secretion system protein GspI [Psychromonas sp. psych-6C06]|uniref:type II secretion system minor pseudopilin GspI n=1 Tax=Psychromonas sp. psych-6C06 TaxID=2058089 RepID=UPI000C32DAB3|nr:type II secretion system minor pseudopilin GspI [Psychromonas sp. psych-6C06]PKF61453.1 type II secretion system protein GspI [Psychromonas sp. psych-6C06]